MRMLPWITASLHANFSFHACYTCDLCLVLLYTRVAHASCGTTHDKTSQFEKKSNWWHCIEAKSFRNVTLFSRLPTISFGTNFLLGTICKSQDFLVFDESQLQFVFLTVSALRLTLTTFKTEKSILFCYLPPVTVRMHRLQKQGLYWTYKLKSVARDIWSQQSLIYHTYLSSTEDIKPTMSSAQVNLFK